MLKQTHRSETEYLRWRSVYTHSEGDVPSPAPHGLSQLQLLLCPLHLAKCAFIPQWHQRPNSALMWVGASPVDLSWNSTFVPLGWICYHLHLYFVQLLRTRQKLVLQHPLRRQRFLTLYSKLYIRNKKSRRNYTTSVAYSECTSLTKIRTVAVATWGLFNADGGKAPLAQ